jgi:hypothetical protein
VPTSNWPTLTPCTPRTTFGQRRSTRTPDPVADVAQLGPPLINALPHWLLAAMTAGMANRTPPGGYLPFAAFAPALQHEGHEITEMSGTLDPLRRVRAHVLLLGGSKSSPFLKDALRRVEQALPGAQRIELPGLNHSSPWNKQVRGNPEAIAAVLRRFFQEGASYQR